MNSLQLTSCPITNFVFELYVQFELRIQLMRSRFMHVNTYVVSLNALICVHTSRSVEGDT